MENQNVTVSNDAAEIKERIFKEYRGVLIAGVVLVIVVAIVGISSFLTKKSLTLKQPGEKISIAAGNSTTIAWQASKISRIGIALYKDGKASWIAKNLPARDGSYTWTIFEYQEPSSDYSVAVFEYPWKKDSMIAYSSQPIEIIGPRYVSCDDLSVENEWPFIPGNFDGIKKMFVTAGTFGGNLGGLEGADKKCQSEAAQNGYDGTYYALLGDDKTSAQERIKNDGVFVNAAPAMTLKEGRTCHRLIAENSQRLIEKFGLAKEIARIKMDDAFLKSFTSSWVGRISQYTKRDCLEIAGTGSNSYTYTTTCQNWSQGKEKIYDSDLPDFASLERCYDDSGKSIPANFIGAFATGTSVNGDIIIQGRSCASNLHLVCLEQ